MNDIVKKLLLRVVGMTGEDGDLLPSLHTPEQIQKFAELVAIETAEIVELLSQFDENASPFGAGYEAAIKDVTETIRECFILDDAQ